MNTRSDDAQVAVIGGADTHRATHHAVALNNLGLVLGDKEFPTTTAGYRDLLEWMSSFGVVARIGVESTGSYGAGLTRYLSAHGVRVIEVNQPHAHTRLRIGKSDPIDAEAASQGLGRRTYNPAQGDHGGHRGHSRHSSGSRVRGEGSIGGAGPIPRPRDNGTRRVARVPVPPGSAPP